MTLSPERRLAAAAFCVAAVYVPVDRIFSGSYMPRWWAMALLLPLASSLDPRSLDPRIGAFLLAGLAWAGLSLAWTPIPAEGAMDFGFLVVLSLAMVAASGVEDIEPVVAAFAWGIAISGPICLLQWYGIEVTPRSYTPAGLFFSSEIMATTAAPLLVWAIWRHRWVLAVLMAIPVAVCESRVAIVAAGIAALYAWRPAETRTRDTLILTIGIAIVVASTIIGGLSIRKVATAFTRAVLWIAGAENLTIFGKGIGWWPVAFPGPLEEYAHSDVLQLAVELGVGSLFLLAVPVMILRKGAAHVAERSAFVCLCVEGLIGFPSHLPATGFLAAVLAGNMARARHRVRGPELSGGADASRDLEWARSQSAGMV